MSQEQILKLTYVEFWTKVGQIQKSEDPLFKQLSAYALAVCSLLCSNAYIERVFSVLNFVKTNRRNRLNIEMLDAILFLKNYLQVVHLIVHF